MIKHTQSKLHEPELGISGNCFRTCVASILECEIDDIPVIEDMENFPVVDDLGWFPVFIEWLMDRDVICLFSESTPAGLSVMTGASALGECGHSVIAENGVMVHDPHPTKLGLIGKPWNYMVIRPLSDFAMEFGEVLSNG